MKIIDYLKNSFCFSLFATALASTSNLYANELEFPSQTPLSLTEGVPPNILVTLDDSGSMAWGYVDDSISGVSGRRAARSSAYNPMYYNPDVVYQPPKKVTYTGGKLVVNDYVYGIDYHFTKAPSSGYIPNQNVVDLSRNYRLGWSGINSFTTNCPVGLTCSSGRAKAHYFRYLPSPSCPVNNVSSNDNCYALEFISGEEQEKNFATWYSFYRYRGLATRTAANLAFYNMPDNVRITWGALNTCSIGNNVGGSCYGNKITRFSGQHRANFFKWLANLPASGGTPLNAALTRAGNFLENNADAYRDESGNSYACRASYHVLMTDGIYSGDSSGNRDNTAINLPDGTRYEPKAPYRDSNTGSLADNAFYYWSRDLKSGLANNIPAYIPIQTGNSEKDYWDPRNNPATWQHMVNFTVGLGLSKSLTSSTGPTWEANTNSPTFAHIDELMNLGANNKNWPPTTNNDGKVYDLWHAAINSRGEFFSADTPEALVHAFQRIMERVAGQNTTGSSPAINSGVDDDGTGYSYQASYDSSKGWAGQLSAFKSVLNTDGSVHKTKIWDASDLLDKNNFRRILMAGSGITKLQDFEWDNLTASQKQLLNRDPDKGENTDNKGRDRVAFIRGDRSKEGTYFRNRTTVLGDIVNSKPATVRGARYLASYANKIEDNSSDYTSFVVSSKNRTPMVYVGANDGMLHAFNANTGNEVFAFIPSDVIQNLNKLTATGYGEAGHHFYVDGSPVVADVFIENRWRTVLVGTLRAGGKGLFALDVTEPSSPKLLWEFSEDQLHNRNVKLGYSFPKPTIARLHNGRWAVVTGNGYSAAGSNNGKAALLIIDIETGELTSSLEVSGTNGVANGLSTPRLADINGDGIADFAYAGDLQGNMWRFDLAPNNGDPNNPFMRKGSPRSNEQVTFQVSFGGNPLYTAVNNAKRQPITSAPSLVRHPSRLGYLVVFGTGKYFAEGDKNGSLDVKNTLYGIWDPSTKVARSFNKSSFPYAGNFSRSNLQEQKMEQNLHSVKNGEAARLLSNNQVAWAERNPDGSWRSSKPGNTSLKVGWYFDLAIGREMIIEDMIQLGRTLYFQSLVPNADPCSSGVDNWTYAIDPVTGGRTTHHAWIDFRSNSDDKTVITAIKMDGEGGLSIGQKPDHNFEICTGGICNLTQPSPDSMGRQSWRLVEGL